MNARIEARSGIVEGMPAEEYHAGPELSSTMLNAMAESPAHCWANHINPQRPPREATAAMIAGTLAHTVVLEPNQLPLRYAVKPLGHDGRSTAGKLWCAENASRIQLSIEQMRTAEAQCTAVLAVPEIAKAMASGTAELSVFWTDDATGLPCRARPDWVHMLPDGRAIVLDLKTTSDASPQGFARKVAQFGYHRQQAHYVAGLAANGIEVAAFLFAAVTGAYPFIAVPYMLDDDAIMRGADERRRLMERFAECRATNKWPGYGEGVQVLSLPPWARLQEEVI